MAAPALLAAAALVLLAGCIADPIALDAASGAPDAAAAPVGTFVWEGRVVASVAEGAAHARELTPIIKPFIEEGFTVDVNGAPTAIRVDLFWNATGVASEFWIRAHSPHPTSGESHAVKDYNSEPSSDRHLCVEVDPADVAPGQWIFMGRPRDDASFAGTFTMVITSPGAELALYDEVHGHPFTDAAGLTGEPFDEGKFVDC